MSKLLLLFFLITHLFVYPMNNVKPISVRRSKRKRNNSFSNNAKRVKVSSQKNNPTTLKATKGRKKRKREDKAQAPHPKRVKLSDQQAQQRARARKARAQYFSDRFPSYIFYYLKKG